MPSLRQLNEAVLAFIAENPGDLVTVVVDATFGHRIDPKEVADFNEAIENNELVTPPAGAIGRGDAFVLAIADKVKASVLSNDSFQELHGQYEWLFDEGRLIGGKPVPHIGWVFLNRTPVRGPTSRKAVRDAKRSKPNGDHARPARVSKAANQPMPVPKSPPPRPTPETAPAAETMAAPTPGRQESPGAGGHFNDLVSFLGFVEAHPVGTTLSAVVESYSSHGAYVRMGEVSGYVPLRLMGDPPPRSARSVMALGEAVTLVVAGFNPGRRGIDLGLPGAVPSVASPAPKSATPSASADAATGARRGRSSRSRASQQPEASSMAATPEPTSRPRARRASTELTSPTAVEAVDLAPAKKAPAKKAPAKKAPAKKAPAKKAPAKKAPAKKALGAASTTLVPTPSDAAKPTRATKAASAEQPGAKSTGTKKTAAKKVPATAVASPDDTGALAGAKVPAAKVPAAKTPAEKIPTKKAPAKKAAAKSVTTNKAAAGAPVGALETVVPAASTKQAAAKKPAAKKASTSAAVLPGDAGGLASKKVPAKKVAAKKAAPTKTAATKASSKAAR